MRLLVVKKNALFIAGRAAAMIPHCSTFHIKSLTMQSQVTVTILDTHSSNTDGTGQGAGKSKTLSKTLLQ